MHNRPYILYDMDYGAKKSYVYLICDSAQELYKIGVTKNLYSKRMKQLQTGNGTELHIVNYHETYYPFRIEKLLHNRFQSKREHGEWFRLDMEDITSFSTLCEEFEEFIDLMKVNPFFAKKLR